MVHLLEDCNLCAIHAKRVTISAPLHPAWAAPGSLGTSGSSPRPVTRPRSRLAQPRARLRAMPCFVLAPAVQGQCLTGCVALRLAAEGCATACCCALRLCSAHCSAAVPKDLQLARRIRGPIAGVSSY